MLDFELDDPLPAKVIPYGMKSHPMYKQWVKMIDSCVDPKHKLYPNVGAKGITVMHRWFDFSKFVEDNQHLFEDEPSKPANLRNNFIRRKNIRAGFNPKNIEWVPRAAAVAIQAKTVCVDTYYGKNMPIKQLAELLQEKADCLEELPDEAPTWVQWRHVFNEQTERLERKKVPIKTVPAVKLYVLRKRAKEGLTGWDLLAPLKEYGKAGAEDERQNYLCAKADRERQPLPADAPYWMYNR